MVVYPIIQQGNNYQKAIWHLLTVLLFHTGSYELHFVCCWHKQQLIRQEDALNDVIVPHYMEETHVRIKKMTTDSTDSCWTEVLLIFICKNYLPVEEMNSTVNN
jgi:hypothetical protein